MMTFEEQLEAYGAIVPDCPLPLPCWQVNRSLWRLFQRFEPQAQESQIFTEQEVVRRMDLFYMADGTCQIS